MPRKKVALAVVDAVATAGAILLAVLIRVGWDEGLLYIQTHVFSIVSTWVLFLLAFYIGGLYESQRLLRLAGTLSAAVISVVLGGLLVTAFFFATMAPEIGRGVFFGFAVFVLVAVVINRVLYIVAVRRGFMADRCLIIGSTVEARKVVELIHSHAHAGMKIFGIIQPTGEHDGAGRFIGEYPVLGNLSTLDRFVSLYDINRLILAASVDYEPVLLQRLRTFRYRGLALLDFVTLYEELAQEIPLDHINDEWLFMASMNNSRFHIRRMKRVVDISAAVTGLIMMGLPTAVAAALVRLTSPGPALFRQERVGRDSKPFTLLKLRTMCVNAEEETGPVWAMDNDPRITRIGKWLRMTRLDEVPQLWCVLRGDMSLIGPRPEREVFVRKLTEKIPFYAERLLVAPGITGWAQVMHPYTASIEESRRKLQYDLYYIKHMSFFLDTYIMIKTFKTMIFGRERAKTQTPAPASAEPPAALKTRTISFPPAKTPADKLESGG